MSNYIYDEEFNKALKKNVDYALDSIDLIKKIKNELLEVVKENNNLCYQYPEIGTVNYDSYNLDMNLINYINFLESVSDVLNERNQYSFRKRLYGDGNLFSSDSIYEHMEQRLKKTFANFNESTIKMDANIKNINTSFDVMKMLIGHSELKSMYSKLTIEEKEIANLLITKDYDKAFKKYNKYIKKNSDSNLEMFFLNYINETLIYDIKNSPDGILDENDEFINILNANVNSAGPMITKIVENYSGVNSSTSGPRASIETNIYLSILDSFKVESPLYTGVPGDTHCMTKFKLINFENPQIIISGTYVTVSKYGTTSPNHNFEFTQTGEVSDYSDTKFHENNIKDEDVSKKLSILYAELAYNLSGFSLPTGIIETVKLVQIVEQDTSRTDREKETILAEFSEFYHGKFYATETGDIIFIKYNDTESKERIESGYNDREAERESKLGYIKKSNMGDAAKVLAVNILYGTKEVESNPNLLEGININVDMSEISVGDIEKINSIIQVP